MLTVLCVQELNRLLLFTKLKVVPETLCYYPLCSRQSIFLQSSRLQLALVNQAQHFRNKLSLPRGIPIVPLTFSEKKLFLLLRLPRIPEVIINVIDECINGYELFKCYLTVRKRVTIVSLYKKCVSSYKQCVLLSQQPAYCMSIARQNSKQVKKSVMFT